MYAQNRLQPNDRKTYPGLANPMVGGAGSGVSEPQTFGAPTAIIKIKQASDRETLPLDKLRDMAGSPDKQALLDASAVHYAEPKGPVIKAAFFAVCGLRTMLYVFALPALLVTGFLVWWWADTSTA